VHHSVIGSPAPNTPSSGFTTPTNTESSARNRRMQALTPFSPPKALQLEEKTDEPGEGSSRANPITLDTPEASKKSQTKNDAKKKVSAMKVAEKSSASPSKASAKPRSSSPVVNISDEDDEDGRLKMKEQIMANVKKNKRRKKNEDQTKKKKEGNFDADEEEEDHHDDNADEEEEDHDNGNADEEEEDRNDGDANEEEEDHNDGNADEEEEDHNDGNADEEEDDHNDGNADEEEDHDGNADEEEDGHHDDNADEEEEDRDDDNADEEEEDRDDDNADEESYYDDADGEEEGSYYDDEEEEEGLDEDDYDEDEDLDDDDDDREDDREDDQDVNHDEEDGGSSEASRGSGNKRRVTFSDTDGDESEGQFQDAEESEDGDAVNKARNSPTTKNATRGRGKQSQRPSNTRKAKAGGKEAESEEVEEDGVFLWKQSQILSAEEYAAWAKQQQEEGERGANEQQGTAKKTSKAQQAKSGRGKLTGVKKRSETFGPSHRTHLLQKIQEATEADEAEAALALGEALRRSGARTATAILQRACGVITERFKERVQQKLAQAVKSKQRTIKIKRRTSEESDQEEEGRDASVKTKRGREEPAEGSNKAKRVAERVRRPQRREEFKVQQKLQRKSSKAQTVQEEAGANLDRRQRAAIHKRGGITGSTDSRSPPASPSARQHTEAAKSRNIEKLKGKEENRNLASKKRIFDERDESSDGSSSDVIITSHRRGTPEKGGKLSSLTAKSANRRPTQSPLLKQQEIDAGIFRVMQDVQDITQCSMEIALQAARMAYEAGGTFNAARAINIYYEDNLGGERKGTARTKQAGSKHGAGGGVAGGMALGDRSSSKDSREGGSSEDDSHQRGSFRQESSRDKGDAMGVLPMTTVPEWGLGEPPEGGPHYTSFKSKLTQFEKYKNQTANRTTVTFKSCIAVDLCPALEGKCGIAEHAWNEIMSEREERAALKAAKERGEEDMTPFRSGWSDDKLIAKLKATLKPPRVEDYEIKFEAMKFRHHGLTSELGGKFETWATFWHVMQPFTQSLILSCIFRVEQPHGNPSNFLSLL
jgi:hypothetical protein